MTPAQIRRLEERIKHAYKKGRLSHAYYLETCIRIDRKPFGGRK